MKGKVAKQGKTKEEGYGEDRPIRRVNKHIKFHFAGNLIKGSAKEKNWRKSCHKNKTEE
jgi:hypothetical protein